jgi:non-ribosomal peptide synthetase component F
MVVYENYPLDQSMPSALTISDVQARGTTNFPLTVRAYLGGELQLHIDYDPRLFTTATARQIIGRLQLLLASIAANPEQPPGQLRWTTDQELQQTLIQSSGTSTAIPAGTVASLFAEQVRRPMPSRSPAVKTS